MEQWSQSENLVLIYIASYTTDLVQIWSIIQYYLLFIFIYLKKIFNIYLFLRDTERKSTSGGEAEREGDT